MASQFDEGEIVMFSRTPNGSYLSAGEAYMVENVGSREVYFRNVQRGSGTSDSHAMLRTAQWVVVSK